MRGSHHHHHRTKLVHTTKKALFEVRNEINVTPLVDVCLVLLIIFMVVTDKLTRGKEVPLPKAKNVNVTNDTGEDLIVSLTKDGPQLHYWWDREMLKDIDTLTKTATEELRRRPRKIFVKADADLRYADVYPVLIALHEAGSPGVQLGTAELKEK